MRSGRPAKSRSNSASWESDNNNEYVLPTDLTVGALIEHDGRFLVVEEESSGLIVVTQPGGHLEAGESPEQAACRETMEETGCAVDIRELLGVYLWIHPQTRQQFLRIMFVADLVREHSGSRLDRGIRGVHWYSRADLKRRARDLRTPVVLRCVDDYLAGQRQAQDFLASMLPLQQNVPAVLANASLV